MGPLPLSILVVFVLPWWVAGLCVVGGAMSFALPFILDAAARRDCPSADTAASSLVLHYPSLLLWGSLCLLVGSPLGLTALVVSYPPRDGEDTFSVVLAYMMFTAPWAVLVWEVFRFRLEVGPDGLNHRSPWRGHMFVRWVEVECVSFDSPMGHFRVCAIDGRTVRFPALVGSLGAFLEACERRLSPSQLRPTLLAYLFLGRAFPE